MACRSLLPNFQFDYASGWEDICFKNGPIVSVPFFRDVVMPRYKRIRKKLDQYGICPDMDQNHGTMGHLADELRQSTVWYFWWD